MVIKPVSPSANGKPLSLGASLPPQEYRPFDTSVPDVVFTRSVPAFWAMMYVDRSGNVKEATNLPMPVFSAQAREEFVAAKNRYIVPNQHSNLDSPHTTYIPSRSPGHRGRSGRIGHSKRRRTALRAESLAVDCIEVDEHNDNNVPLEIGDTKKVTAYYENAFRRLQQLNCRLLAKNFIKLIEPRKQVKHPYNGGRPRAGAPPGEKGDPELTKPDWWPRDVIHREPDHLRKEYRLKLLVHIVQRLLPMGITADKLQEAANDSRRHIKPQERAVILDEVFRVRRLEERYERNEIDGTTQIYVIDHEGAKRGEPDSDDEQLNGVVTPPDSPDEQQLEVSQSPLGAASMSQHVSPLEPTSSFHMPSDLNFTTPGQRTPEFGVSQPEINHRSLASTPLTGPFTPNSNQFMSHPSFVTSTPTDQMHGVSQDPAHTQTDPSASFAGWSPTFQQNMFSPVEYNGASRPMPSQMAYPAYGVYSSVHGHDGPLTYAVPDLARSREYDMTNMANLPFRTGSLSHPHVLHRSDGVAGPDM